MFEVEVIRNEPAYRPRPADLTGYHRYSGSQFDAFVHKEKVLKAIADWSWERTDTEIVGRLVGRPYRDDQGYWIVVTHAILARFTGGVAAVRTTAADGAEIARSLEQDHPAEDLLGWFHSHLCGLEQYSSTDKTNQAEWRKPYHVGLLAVVRPTSVRIHAFRGPECERLAEPHVCPTVIPSEPSGPEEVATSGPYVPASSLLGWQAAAKRYWIGRMAHIAIWPVVALVGVHMLASAVSQIEFPVVVHRSVECDPILDELNRNTEATPHDSDRSPTANRGDSAPGQRIEEPSRPLHQLVSGFLIGSQVTYVNISRYSPRNRRGHGDDGR